MAIRMYNGDGIFTLACKLAEVLPTHRQWRKWCRGFGSAFRFAEQARKQHLGKE